MKATFGLALTLLLAVPSAAGTLTAQSPEVVRVGSAALDPGPAPVPFGPGERLEYQVKLGMFSAGEGYMAVEGVDSVRGRPAYHLKWGIKGGMLFAKVNDTYQSWLDTNDLVSRHFIKDVHEVNYKSFKEFAIYPEERRWQQLDEDHSDTMDTDEPLDELSFIYWLRTLPLQVGDVYTLPRYFERKGNPVVIHVLRKERKKVPAGEFNTIVLQPIIRTEGLFAQGGKAEIYLTDDANRHLVYMRSEVPVVGSISMHLRRVVRGTPLSTSASGASADSAAGTLKIR